MLDTEDSRRSGFVDMLLNIDADTTPSEIENSSTGAISMDSGNPEGSKSLNEKRQTTMMSCMGKLSDHLYIFQNNVTSNLGCG